MRIVRPLTIVVWTLVVMASSVSPVEAQNKYWLEIAAHTSGAFGSEWRTVVVARNDGEATAQVTLHLHAPGGQGTLVSFIPPGTQEAFEDVVGLMGIEGVGSLEIHSTEPLDVIGRIYNETADGTFGQFLQGFEQTEGMSAGDSAWLLGLRQLGDQYRSNLSVTNIGSNNARVRISLFDTDGAEIGEYTVALEPGEVKQNNEPISRRLQLPDLGWAFAQVSVLSGDGVLASASVIDSRTNDATTIAMTRPGCASSREESSQWLEIATHGPGAFESQWRTLAVARNTGSQTAVVTFVLHGQQEAHDFTTWIEPGAQGVYDDLVGTMGLEAKGTVEVQSSQPLDIVGRIYSATPEGTFGQFVNGARGTDALEEGDSAWLLGLRQIEETFRSNLSVTNAGDRQARVKVTLFDSDGTPLTSYHLAIDPSTVVQDSTPILNRAGISNLEWGFAEVEVISGGGIFTSASVVDSRTNDATTISMKPGQPLEGCRPAFDGVSLATSTAADELTVAWMPAQDDDTPASEILYQVYVAEDAEALPHPSRLAMTVRGETHAVVGGLTPGTAYAVLVVAVDQNGLTDDGGGLRKVKTLGQEPVLRETAVVELAEDLGLGGASAVDTTLVFSNPDDATVPTVGAYLFGAFEDGGGYFRRVTGVSQTESEIRVDTEEAVLGDPYQHFELYTVGVLTDPGESTKGMTEQPAKSSPDIGIWRSTRHDGGQVARMTWPDKLLTLQTVRHKGSQDGLVYGTAGGEGNSFVAQLSQAESGQVTLVADINFHPNLITAAEIEGLELKQGEMIARGTLDLTALARYEWTAGGSFERTLPIFTTSWTATYLAGGVPVYQKITLSMDAEINAVASAAIEASAAASATAVVEVGARYANGSWQAISDIDFSRSLGADLSVRGSVEAGIRLVPRLEVEFYETLAGWITIEPSLQGQVDVEATAMPSCTPLQISKFDFGLDVDALVGIDWTLLCRTTLFEANAWTSPHWTLFNLPEATIHVTGSGPVDLLASTQDGAGNPFDSRSAQWHVSPDTGAIQTKSDPREAVLTCSSDGNYTVTFSGHGNLGELARRCVQLEVNCQTERTPSISNIILDPATPATLDVYQKVHVRFDYKTYGEDDVAVWAIPYTNGEHTPTLIYQASPALPPNGTSVERWFTVFEQGTLVDEVGIIIRNLDGGETILQKLVPVHYEFMHYPEGSHSVSNLVLNPPSPSTLNQNDQVECHFDYETTAPYGVGIGIFPYTNGSFSPASQSSIPLIYATGAGSGSSHFTIGDDWGESYSTVAVDHLRIVMIDRFNKRTLFEEFVPVDYVFTRP